MNLTKELENIANLTIIILAIVLVGLLARNYYFGTPKIDSVSVGEKIVVPELDFSNSNHTLVVALRHDCHFCEESKDFYQSLLQYASNAKDIKVVAVFSEENQDSKGFLEGMNPKFPNVKTVPFRTLRINATPTIIDVNRHGLIQAVWRGKLPPDREGEFFASLKQ